MSQEKKLYYIKKKPLIDASVKSELKIILEDSESSYENYEKELNEILKSLEHIRQSNFAKNAAIERVQSRTLKDIFLIRLHQLSKQQTITDSEKKA